MAYLFMSTDGINYEPLGEVGTLSFDSDNIINVPNEPSESAHEELISIMKNPVEASFEMDVSYLNKFKLLELFTGIKTTNNYLKMHDGIMQRHNTINRYRKKRGRCKIKNG